MHSNWREQNPPRISSICRPGLPNSLAMNVTLEDVQRDLDGVIHRVLG